MPAKIISSLATQLNDYLKLRFRLTEDIAFVSPSIKDVSSSFPANRISISIVNMERENAGGLPYSQQPVNNTLSKKTASPWLINCYLLLASIFTEKQYAESIQILSGVMAFLQKNSLFINKNRHITIELVNLSFHEISNLWSICGGTYYPSIICKVRGVEVDEQEIADFSTLVKEHGVDSNLKWP